MSNAVVYTSSLRAPGVVDGSELEAIPRPDGTWRFRALAGGTYVDVAVPDDQVASFAAKLQNPKPPQQG